jgi:hypothetical protein
LRRELFQPSIEGEARVLILIDAFSGGQKCLEGRTKLAKLDFLLRYPGYFARALKMRSNVKTVSKADLEIIESATELNNIEHRMVRFRYGPWDPAYYGLIGRLIGKGLIEPVSINRGIGFKATTKGREIARKLADDPYWNIVSQRSKLLRKHFDLTGTSLKDFIYDFFPEVTSATWGEEI